MPGGDGTGPFGTFRNCMPVDAQGNRLPFYGRGFFGRGFYGRPFGRGRGFRFRYYATGVPGRAWFGQPYYQQGYWQPYPAQGYGQPSQEEFKQQEIKELEQELEAIKKRLAELKK